MFADEIARARPCLNQPAVLQQVVGLEHGGRADAVGAAGVAHRGHLFSRREHAAAYQFGNLVGEFLVALHRVRAVAVGHVADLEAQLAAEVAGVVEQRHADRQIGDLARGQGNLARSLQCERPAFQPERVAARLLGLVDQLEAVHVFDLPLHVLAVQRAVAGDVQL